MVGIRRNYGCRINTDLTYKGLRLLLLENELIRLSILVDKGTDIIELLYKPKDIDFMWSSPIDFKKGELNRSDFIEGYLGGWQEIIPNGGDNCEYKGANFNYHDETPQLSWDYKILEESPKKISIKFYSYLKKMPFYIEKIITIESNKSHFLIDENLYNYGNERFDFMWGHHPCFGEPFLSGDCLINFEAEEIISSIESISENPFVKANSNGTLRNFPGIDNKMVDLSRVMDKNSRVSDLLYVTKLIDNWFSITNIKKEVGIGYVFSESVFRYLWLWLSYGGSNGYPWFGNAYNLAIEPWSSWPGRGLLNAIENNTSLKIKPGQAIASWLKVVIFERDNDVKKINDNCEIL